MVKVILKKLIGDQFKGETHFEHDFYETTYVTGENGSGKTTLADLWDWIFTDKDYSLVSNPKVHPDFLAESEPSGTAVCDIIMEDENGTGTVREVTFRKFQKDNRTKKQKESGAPVRITNQYEINAVPKSQKDFIAYLSELGIDIDNFLLLSHPEVYTSQKSADCRKVLFGMTSCITDKEIADSLSDCVELGALLENYSIEEVFAKTKRDKKEAEQNLDAIPEQIIGMEKVKTVIDEAEYLAKREELLAKKDELEKDAMAIRVPSIGDLNQQLVVLEKEEKALIAEANSERVTKLTEANALVGDLKVKYNSVIAEKERFETSIEDDMRYKNTLEREYEDLSHQFQAVKASEFDASNQKCPTCGQDLPIHEIDKASQRFEEERKRKMDAINNRAKEIRDKVIALKKSIAEAEHAIKNGDGVIAELKDRIDKAIENRAKYETVISVAGTPEHGEILRQIAETHHAINKRDELVAQEDAVMAKLRECKQEIREIDDVLAQVKANERIDEQIAEAKEMQKKYSQASAEASKVLDQIKTVSMEKNRRLTDEVNSHFEIVKFRLFEQQINGDFKDCCIPTIRNDDGVYREFGSSANTALEVLGKLDIINGLQKFYGVYLPVWLDGAECLDDKSMKQIHMNTQFIALSVSDGKLTVKEN